MDTHDQVELVEGLDAFPDQGETRWSEKLDFRRHLKAWGLGARAVSGYEPGRPG